MNDYATVKWWYYSERTGNPLRWSQSHYAIEDRTLCGYSVPEADDRLVVVHWGIGYMDCSRCRAIIGRLYAQQQKDMAQTEFDDRLKAIIKSSPVFRFNLFTLEECKTELSETDGRRVAAALLRIGYVRRNNMWTKPVHYNRSKPYQSPRSLI